MKAFVLALTVCTAVLAAEPPAIPGLEPIPGATRATTTDPSFAAMADVTAAFDLPLSPAERMQVAVARLATLVQSPSARDRHLAAFVNGELGHLLEQRVVIQNLRTLLADPDRDVRMEAILSCGGCTGLHQVALPALPAFKPLFADPDPDIRRAARLMFTRLSRMNALKSK